MVTLGHQQALVGLRLVVVPAVSVVLLQVAVVFLLLSSSNHHNPVPEEVVVYLPLLLIITDMAHKSKRAFWKGSIYRLCFSAICSLSVAPQFRSMFYFTVTLFAKFLGISGLFFLKTAKTYASICTGIIFTIGDALPASGTLIQ